ncbi:MAG: sodium:solute symporter family protein [Clostridia bacterium]|nr:sodium:solute symporter family protein [Clostridia bacterium]
MNLTLVLICFAVFMAINVVIGLMGRSHAKTTKDFLTASGQSSIWFVMASAVGASIGSGVVIGTTQYAVKLGVAGAWYAIACGLAGIVYALVMSNFVYRNKLVSLSDYFKRRYDSNFIVLLYSGIGPFACAAAMGAQLVAAKAIFKAFGIDPVVGLIITAAIMLIYTMFAGLWGSYATALFQVVVIIVGVLFVGGSMWSQGGFTLVRETFPAERFDLFNITPELWMMFVGPMLLSVLVDQSSVQRVSSAKSEKIAFWGHFLSSVPLILFGLLMVYIGMWGAALFPEAGTSAFITLLLNNVSPIICAVMLCAILAAIMSTASGALVATDALVVHDLYCGFINKNASEKQKKTLNTIVNIVVSAAAVICAIAFDSVIDLLSNGYTIMLSGTLVPLIGGLVWKRGTTKGAAASAFVGMVFAFLCLFKVISVPFASIFPVLPAIVTYIVVSLVTKHAPTENTARVAEVIGTEK